ncbi:MAG: GNAT family N-acetyltransferase [Candidatus Nanoarchaeia archaeon]
MLIRKYTPSDREAVEQIHFETGFLGSSMSKWLSNNNVWRKRIKYYLEKEPESIFLLEDKGKIKGYILGFVKDRNYERKAMAGARFILVALQTRFSPKKDRKFWGSQFNYLLNIILGKSGELKLKYPKNAGHIHINLLPEVRGKGWGTKLLKEYEKHAKKSGAKIIYANSFQTGLNNNKNFWLRNGFKEHSKVKSLHWKNQLPKEEIHLTCYYKKI